MRLRQKLQTLAGTALHNRSRWPSTLRINGRCHVRPDQAERGRLRGYRPPGAALFREHTHR